MTTVLSLLAIELVVGAVEIAFAFYLVRSFVKIHKINW